MYLETPFRLNSNLITLLKAYFRHFWPEAVVSCDNGLRKDFAYLTPEDVPIGSDFVIYDSLEAVFLTDRLGWVPQTAERSLLCFHLEEGFDFDFGDELYYNWCVELLTHLKFNRRFLELVEVL